MSDIERVNDSRWADPPEGDERFCADCDHSEHNHDIPEVIHDEERDEDLIVAGCSVKGCKCMNFREREIDEVEFEN